MDKPNQQIEINGGVMGTGKLYTLGLKSVRDPDLLRILSRLERIGFTKKISLRFQLFAVVEKILGISTALNLGADFWASINRAEMRIFIAAAARECGVARLDAENFRSVSKMVSHLSASFEERTARPASKFGR